MLKRVVVAAVPCLLVLSGCGVAGTEFNPGVAARVGDETISLEDVDKAATRFCEAVDSRIAESGGRAPLVGFKTQLVAQMAMKSAAEQVAEQYGVTSGPDYLAQVAAIRDQAASNGYEGGDLERFVEVQAVQAYYFDLLTQVGAIKLAEEGEEEPTVDFQTSRGLDEVSAWIEREGIEFDPRYGIEIVDGAPDFSNAAGTDVTFAVSDAAKSGLAIQTAQEPDLAYSEALPLASTCG